MEKVDLVQKIVSEPPEADGAPLGMPIEPTQTERWGVPASMLIGYAYVLSIMSDHWKVWLLAFAAMLCAGAGLAFREERRRGECWVWLGCLWTCLLCGIFGRNRVWDLHVWYFIHAFGAYWLIARSGRLLDGESGCRLPADLWYGLAVYPFRHFLLRVRVARSGGRSRGRGRLNAAAVAGTVLAAIVAAFLFSVALLLLSDADPNFQRWTDGVWLFFEKLDPAYLFYFLLSLPVGAYLYGMVFGARRETPDAVAARRARIDAGVAALRKVPGTVWPVLLGAFAAMYLAFFALQGSYLFDGLRSVLPEQFTAAQYARRGFFELCGVMAVNFGLLGAAALSAEGGLRARPAAKGMSAVLIAESALFAVTAAAKLALYIRRFGFTPLRLQSAWLVLVLFAGCAAAMRALLTGRDTAKPWLIFAGVTLALTHLW